MHWRLPLTWSRIDGEKANFGPLISSYGEPMQLVAMELRHLGADKLGAAPKCDYNQPSDPVMRD
jgi:hypothetical protein